MTDNNRGNALLQALATTDDPTTKPALIAELAFTQLSADIALVARRCSLLRWFDESIVNTLVPAAASGSAEKVYAVIEKLPFVEHLPWGLTYHNQMRTGLLALYSAEQPELLRHAAALAAPAYLAHADQKLAGPEVLFCLIVAGQTEQAQVVWRRLSDELRTHGNVGDLHALVTARDQAEALPFVVPLSLIAAEDLEQAIVDFQQAVALSQVDSPNRHHHFNNLGLSLINRYQSTGRLEDLEQAIVAFQQAVLLTPADAPNRHHYFNNLGASLSIRYRSTGRLEDLEQMIRVYRQAVAQPSTYSSDLPHYLGNLGNGLYDRYIRTGQIEDLEQAFEWWRRAIELTPSDSPELPSHLNNLATGLRDRYIRTGQVTDLEQAFDLWQRAIELTPTNSPDLPRYLISLGTGLHERYVRTGREDDLEQAIQISQQAVDLTALDSPYRPFRLSDFGNRLYDRYTQLGEPADLEQALYLWQQAVAQLSPNSPYLPSILINLGNGLRDLYLRRGQITDLERAIQVCRQGVSQITSDSPYLPSILNNLGNALGDRYAQTGQIADLEEMIQVYQQAVAQTTSNSPDLPSRLSNLGLGLRDRYDRTGRLEDLRLAVAAYQQAVAQTARDAPSRPMYLNNLGLGLHALYKRTGHLEDLEQAIAIHKQAVAQIFDTPALSMYLNNLGIGLFDRYKHADRLEDLEQAIVAHKQAVAQTALDTPNRSMYLSNLGNSLRARYRRIGRLEDLEQAIVANEQAVAQTAINAPRRPSYLSNLGNGLRDRYERTRQREDLEQGSNAYIEACRQGLVVAQEDALRSAGNWGAWASERKNWAEASTAYNYGMAAIDRLFAVQLMRSDQEDALGQGIGLHARAAYALTCNGDLEKAAIAIERGRARLLAMVLERNRRDLENLPARGHADLYQRYRDAIDHQQALRPKLEVMSTAGFRLTDLERSQALTAAQAEIAATITAIQQIPGYEDFFAQPTIAQLQTVAQAAPLVYLLTTEAGGLALIVQADKITPVWLEGFTEEKLRALLNEWLGAYRQQHKARQTWFDTMARVTHILWDVVMGPVAAALHNLTSPAPNLERGSGSEAVTLIPTGLLSLLPLHAAWTEDNQTGSRRYFLDEFVVNYAPSARALTHATTTAQQVTGTQLLAVDEPRPVRGNALPNSATEVAAIADHFVQPQQFKHSAATRAAILAALPQAEVAHFSCHGGNDWQNPLESGLMMAHNEMLTVRDLLELQLPGARLATLSACETGIVGTNLPDEVVALPSALVQAGFAGVVASLWSVADISTAMLMARFYEFWQKDKMQPAPALRAAQRWVRDTTNREKADHFDQAMLDASSATRMPEIVAADFFSAVMIHKEGQDARSFAHPFWWAAFYLTGV